MQLANSSLRLETHERTKCVHCNTLCDVRCSNRKKPTDPNIRGTPHSYVGIYWFLSISITDVTKCVTMDAFCALVWPQPQTHLRPPPQYHRHKYDVTVILVLLIPQDNVHSMGLLVCFLVHLTMMWQLHRFYRCAGVSRHTRYFRIFSETC
jgi:hypothetical protein